MTTETNTEGGGDGGSQETVMDAINEALGLGADGDDQVETQDTGDTGADDADGVLEAGDDQDAAGATDEVDNGGEQGEGAAGGDKQQGEGGKEPTYAELVAEAGKLGIQQRHANGHIKSAAELKAEIATKQGEKQGDGAAAKKQPDAVNDPIPKELKPETQQRIRTLIDRTKDAETRASAAEENFNYMVNGLKATGTTPEQYGETLSFLALFNSGDPKQQGQALEILEGMADRLATLLGVERKVGDPLANHPDLKLAIQNRQITPELAKEMARQRNQGAFRQELNTHATNAQQQERQAQAELNQARTDLNALEEELKQSDPLYARKKARIVPALKVAFKRMPPSQWKEAFQEAYRTVRVAAAPTQRQKPPAQQPMRAGKAPAGSGASAKTGDTSMANGGPSTMFEAMWGHAPK
jgi:hypothetical protein